MEIKYGDLFVANGGAHVVFMALCPRGRRNKRWRVLVIKGPGLVGLEAGALREWSVSFLRAYRERIES